MLQIVGKTSLIDPKGPFIPAHNHNSKTDTHEEIISNNSCQNRKYWYFLNYCQFLQHSTDLDELSLNQLDLK